MSHKNEEFWIKRSKKEEEAFFARILDGLLDSLSEFEEEYKRIEQLEPQQRNSDQNLFYSHYQAVQLRLKQLEDKVLSFDQKYEIAGKIREDLTEIELL
jgi:hypothetical protein